MFVQLPVRQNGHTTTQQSMVVVRNTSSHLPNSLTKLIGREDELTELAEIIEDARLLTICGPGGVGKTRVALELARRTSHRFRDNVAFVSLAPYESATFITQVTANALVLPLHGPTSEEAQLVQYLQQKELLLIFDNLEQLLPDANHYITTLLEAAPGLTIVATSRVVLNLYGEWIYPLAGLKVPEDTKRANTTCHSAVQLFCESAQRSNKHFRLTDDNLADVVHICRLVDGLPLAIELAASWTQSLSNAEIASQIEKNIDFLQVEWSNLPERHRSLRAVCDHSYRLLSAQEKTAFATLSLFSVSFDLSAANNIAGISASLVQTLLHKSLLRREGATNFSLHPILQRYAAEKLATDINNSSTIEERHSQYYLTLLQKWGTQLFGHEHVDALHVLTTIIDNVRQAWAFALQVQDADAIAASIIGVSRYYQIVGTYQEGIKTFTESINVFWAKRDRFGSLIGQLLVEKACFLENVARYEEALDIAKQAMQFGRQSKLEPLLASAQLQAGIALWRLGDYEQAHELLSIAESTAKAARLPEIEAHVLRAIGITYYRQGNFVQAKEHHARTLTLFEEAGNQVGIAWAHTSVGNVAAQLGDYATARLHCEKALALHRLLSNARGEGLLLNNLGDCSAGEGRLAEALDHFQQALTIHQQMSDRQSQAIALNNLGDISTRVGLLEDAKGYFDRSLALYQQIGDRSGEALALDNLSRLSIQQNAFKQAETYAIHSIAVAEEIGDRTGIGYAQTNLGIALIMQGKWSDAEAVLQEALVLRQKMGLAYLAIETQTALVRLMLAQNKKAEAQTLVQEVINYLTDGSIDGTEEPVRIYLTCYQALRTSNKAAAQKHLASALQLLQEQVEQLDDPAFRQAVLQNIPAHKELLALAVQTPALSAMAGRLLRVLSPSRVPINKTLQSDEERARYEAVECEIHALFRHKTLQKTTPLAQSTLWDLAHLRPLLDAIDPSDGQAKAKALRQYLMNLIANDLHPAAPLALSLETPPEEWIAYLILYKSYVEEKTRIEVIREIQRETGFQLSAGRAYARYLESGRQRLADLLWQREEEFSGTML